MGQLADMPPQVLLAIIVAAEPAYEDVLDALFTFHDRAAAVRVRDLGVLKNSQIANPNRGRSVVKRKQCIQYIFVGRLGGDDDGQEDLRWHVRQLPHRKAK